MSITKAQAQREINRRKGDLPKGVTVAQARARAVSEGTFGMTGPDLKALAGKARSTARKVEAKASQEQAQEVTPLEIIRVLANEEFRVAKEAGGVKAGFAARKAFCEGVAAFAQG